MSVLPFLKIGLGARRHCRLREMDSSKFDSRDRGFMPPGFQYPISDDSQDYWEPIFPAQWLTKEAREERANRFMPVIARLKPGVTLDRKSVV